MDNPTMRFQMSKSDVRPHDGKAERETREGSVNAQVTLQRFSRFSCLLFLTV